MTIRLLCKQTSKHPSNALFPQEQKTRIAPTRIINETELDLTAGMVVTVNWNREKVEVEIRLVYGTFITKTTFTLLFSQYHLQSHYCLSFTCQLCSVTHCRNGCTRKRGCFFKKTKTKTTGVTHRHYDLCFSAARRNLLYSWNYKFQRSIRLENDRVVHSYKAAKALVPERGLR